jgi:hypothetical protein
VHVADGVDVHHQRHERHHQHHQRRQRIDQETDIEAHAPARDPGVDRAIEQMSGAHILEHQPGGDERNDHPQDRDRVRAAPSDHTAEQPGNDRTDQRSERDEKVEGFHALHEIEG